MKRILKYLFPTFVVGCCMCKKYVGIRSKLSAFYHRHFTNELIAISHTYCRKCLKIKDAEFEALKKSDIERKIKSGFYDSDDAMNEVAEKIQTKYRRDDVVDTMLCYLSGGHLQ